MEEVKTSRRGGRTTNDRAEILMRLEKRVEMLVSEIEKDIGLGEPEMIEREAHFEGFTFKFIGGKKAELIDQSLMSAFVVRYEVEVISIGKRDSKRAIEVLTMLRISFKKVEKRIETEGEDKRGEGVSLEYPK